MFKSKLLKQAKETRKKDQIRQAESLAAELIMLYNRAIAERRTQSLAELDFFSANPFGTTTQMLADPTVKGYVDQLKATERQKSLLERRAVTLFPSYFTWL